MQLQFTIPVSVPFAYRHCSLHNSIFSIFFALLISMESMLGDGWPSFDPKNFSQLRPSSSSTPSVSTIFCSLLFALFLCKEKFNLGFTDNPFHQSTPFCFFCLFQFLVDVFSTHSLFCLLCTHTHTKKKKLLLLFICFVC